MEEGWQEMIFKVPSNPLTFYDSIISVIQNAQISPIKFLNPLYSHIKAFSTIFSIKVS